MPTTIYLQPLVKQERDRKQRERVEERVRIKAARASWHKKKGPKLPVMVPGKERKGRVELARRAECIICLCVGVTHCVLPCLHAVYCEGCARMQEARGADRCPVCSAPGGGKAHSCRIDLHIDSESLLFPSGDFV